MIAYPRAAASYHTLEEAFWPGRESDTVRHRLHMAVTGARAALRRALPAVNSIRVLPGAYAWNPTIQIECDYWQLLACCDEGSVAAMTRGVAIYEGEFCSGDSAEWMYALRARASAAYIAMLHGLADDALARGDYQTAARYALRVVEADRGHEGAVRLAMRAFVEMGSRSAAIKEYEALRRWLRLNLATEPSALTKSLRENIVQA